MADSRVLKKIASRIHERAAHCLEFEVNDPRASFVTITRVEVATDLASAKIFYSVLGTPGERSKTEHMLVSAGGFIQRKVVSVLSLRRAPRLQWVYDESIEHAANMDRMIQEALQRDQAIQDRGSAHQPDEDEESGNAADEPEV